MSELPKKPKASDPEASPYPGDQPTDYQFVALELAYYKARCAVDEEALNQIANPFMPRGFNKCNDEVAKDALARIAASEEP